VYTKHAILTHILRSKYVISKEKVSNPDLGIFFYFETPFKNSRSPFSGRPEKVYETNFLPPNKCEKATNLVSGREIHKKVFFYQKRIFSSTSFNSVSFFSAEQKKVIHIKSILKRAREMQTFF
jgi:hypothetical protein